MERVIKSVSRKTFSKAKLNQFTKEQLEQLNDPKSAIELLLTMDESIISKVFKKASANLQNILWEYDVVQRVMILGNKTLEDVNINRTLYVNLCELKKSLKSQTIKSKLYKNKYFIKLVTMKSEMSRYDFYNTFFQLYNIENIFNEMVDSEEFKNKPDEEQFKLINRVQTISSDNKHLPSNLRERYNNIIPLLATMHESIPKDVLQNLNFDEKIYMELNDCNAQCTTIKEYIIEHCKNKTYVETLNDLYELVEEYKKKYGMWRFNDIDQKLFLASIQIEDENIRNQVIDYFTDNVRRDSTIDRESIRNTIARNLYNNTLKFDLDFMGAERPFIEDLDLRLLFFTKFNLYQYKNFFLHGITYDQIDKINVKHVNKIYELIDDKHQDEPVDKYARAIKLILIFGYNRCLEMLEQKKYGEVDQVFLDNIAKANVTRIPMVMDGSKYRPEIDVRFNNLFFKSAKENNFIDMLNDKDSILYKNWYKLFNEYDNIYEECHGEVSIKKVSSILALGNNKQYGLTPDCYRINNRKFLDNIILGNNSKHEDDEVIKETVNIYKKIQDRTESSIPYVEGTAKYGHSYQTARLDDPGILDLGYRATNCMRVLSVGHNHLLHASLCRNGRLLYIYDNNHNLVAFTALKRNGNVLILNSLEEVGRLPKSVRMENIKTALIKAVDDIVSVSRRSNEPIQLVVIGNDNKGNFKNPLQLNETPTIYEKEDEVYKDTDCYHGKLYVIYKDRNLKPENIYKKDPDVSYIDPREPVRIYHYNVDDNLDEVLKVVNSIRYKLNNNSTELRPFSVYDDIYYNKDWYITRYGNLYGGCLTNDPRAIDEYNNYMAYLKSLESKDEEDENIIR